MIGVMNLQKLRGRLLLSLLLGRAVFVGLSTTFDNPVILSPPEPNEESGPFVRLWRTQGDSPGKRHHLPSAARLTKRQ